MSSGGHLASSRVSWGSAGGHLGVIWWASGGHLGVIWECSGLIWGSSGGHLGSPGVIWVSSRSHLDTSRSMCARCPRFAQPNVCNAAKCFSPTFCAARGPGRQSVHPRAMFCAARESQRKWRSTEKLMKKWKTLVLCGRGAFLGSAECCGLRFCYVWSPTPN